jgi:hypothetical protein
MQAAFPMGGASASPRLQNNEIFKRVAAAKPSPAYHQIPDNIKLPSLSLDNSSVPKR